MRKTFLYTLGCVVLYACQNDMDLRNEMANEPGVVETIVSNRNGVHWEDVQNYLQKRASTRSQSTKDESVYYSSKKLVL